MWTTCRALVVVALIAGWVRGTAAGEAPKLQYGFEADKHYGYDITIKVETDDYTSTYTGHTLFWLVSAQDDRITLHCEGSLPAKVERKRANDLTDYGIHGLSSRSVQLVIDRSGKPQRAMRGLEPLPFVLGFLETLTLERLPAEPQNQWKCEQEFEIAEGRFGIHMKFPSRKAKEESEYTITGVQGDLVRMDKKYLMRTGEAAGPYRSAASRVRMDGSGSVVFDRRAGVVSSINMNYTLLLKREDDSRTVTAHVDCRLMTPDRLQQLITELDNKRKQVTGEVYAELPKKPLRPTERTKLLRDLRSQDPKVVEAAIVRLISAERDDRPADFAVPLAGILHETRPWYSDHSREAEPGDRESAAARHKALVEAAQRQLQLRAAERQARSKAAKRDRDVRAPQPGLRPKVAQALIVWATPEAEEALVEATDDQAIFGAGSPHDEYTVADAAYEALITIGTESAARAIAGKIIDPSGKPPEVLKRMGPAAEVPVIELLFDQSGGNAIPRAACEVLAEIGGLRSVPALQQTAQGWKAKSQAQAALEAIAKREGLTVDELLTKAESIEPAITPGATPPASPGFRTWTDASGKFQIEAEMVSVADGVVKLKDREGKTIDVPVDRLSQADRDYVHAGKPAGPGPRPEPSLSSTPQPTPRVTGEPRDTELLGGTGGMEFRFVGRNQEPLLGFRYRVARWGNEQAIALTLALFDRRSARGPDVLVAKEGYAVGGMNVDAQTLVNALQIIFMRLKPDGSLDPSDSYTSSWIGVRSGRPTKTLGGTGAPVIGIYGRRALLLDAVGLVVCGD